MPHIFHRRWLTAGKRQRVFVFTVVFTRRMTVFTRRIVPFTRRMAVFTRFMIAFM
jgi:hypothetical protein